MTKNYQSDRLYFDDAYKTAFEARVVEVAERDNRFDIRLADSFFYPVSGGQPCDVGCMRLPNGDRTSPISISVTEIELKNNQVWLRSSEGLKINQLVECEINWHRRFDHMQQHSGQHVLSQAFLHHGDFPTVGFHLSNENLSIDGEGDVDASLMDSAESIANQIIYENRPIKSYLVSKSELSSLPIRKIPEVESDYLRIVEISDFDWNACGGTHVRNTGEIGMIKLLGTEKIRNSTRIRFACGKRALKIFNQTLSVTTTLSNDLTCATTDLPDNVSKLRQDLRTANKKIKQTQSDLATLLINDLLTKTETENNHPIITHTYKKAPSIPLSTLTNQLANRHHTTTFLASVGSPSTIALAAPKTSTADMNNLISIILTNLEGKGGGSPTFAQGTISKANFDQLNAEITSAKQRWFDEKATSQ